MKAEYWTIIACGIFFAIVAPVYWVLTHDPTGTSALTMTFLLTALLGFYLGVVAKQIPDRPEDRSDGEIADGAGEQGFFPPYSWWPLFCASALAVVVLGVVSAGGCSSSVRSSLVDRCVGWIFEYYRGIHAH